MPSVTQSLARHCMHLTDTVSQERRQRHVRHNLHIATRLNVLLCFGVFFVNALDRIICFVHVALIVDHRVAILVMVVILVERRLFRLQLSERSLPCLDLILTIILTYEKCPVIKYVI